MNIPLSLKIEDWPLLDRQLWEEARALLRFDRRARLARSWSDRRCRIVCQSYGQWLSFLVRREKLDPNASPEDRVTPERLEAFVRELQGRVSPWSVAMMVQALARMLKVMAPSHDWDWLENTISNLKRIAEPSRDKRPHMVDPRELYALGMHLMVEAKERASNGDYHADTMGRDGLMIAMLITSPIRIGNLTMIEIGQHLLSDGDVYLLRFSEEETKTSRAIESELPPDLTPWIDFYLRVHRRHLLGRGAGGSFANFWIDRWGKPMIEHSVRAQIKTRTQDAFGKHVWPHLFRAIAATGMVDHAPEQVALLPDLLGHGNMQTPHRYYVLSSGAMAHKAVQATMLELRQAAAARLKAGRKA